MILLKFNMVWFQKSSCKHLFKRGIIKSIEDARKNIKKYQSLLSILSDKSIFDVFALYHHTVSISMIFLLLYKNWLVSNSEVNLCT